MNVLKSILVGGGAFFVTFATEAQGTFRNMDFGLSQVPSTTPWGTQVLVSQAFPFWTAYYAANQVTTVVYNAVALGSVSIGLLTPDNPFKLGSDLNFSTITCLAPRPTFNSPKILTRNYIGLLTTFPRPLTLLASQLTSA